METEMERTKTESAPAWQFFWCEHMLLWIRSQLNMSFSKPVKHWRSSKSSDDSADSLEELFRGI